jgi:hypothetical protein
MYPSKTVPRIQADKWACESLHRRIHDGANWGMPVWVGSLHPPEGHPAAKIKEEFRPSPNSAAELKRPGGSSVQQLE